MKKLSVWCLTLAMVLSLATPVLAVDTTATEDKETISDAAWDKAHEEGYKLGYADAMAGKAYVELAYADDNDAQLAKSIGYDEAYDVVAKAADTAAALKKLGGTSGKINVRLNDKCVAFPDAFPELKNGSTMVPVRAVVEALKAKVETPDAKTVKITLGDTVITLTIGDVKVSVAKAGKTETITLAAAPYIKENRTYIPLRLISETLGYKVYWDQDYQSVVIIDREAMIAKLNERYKTLNSFMKTQSKRLESNWKSESDLSIALEIVDTINGNQKYNITGKCTAQTAGGTMAMEGNIDLTSLAPMMLKLAAASGETDALSIAKLKSLFGKQSFAMKLLPEGKMYIKTGLYDMLAENFMGVKLDPKKETWYLLGKMDPSLCTAEGYSIGNYLYSIQEMQMEYLSAFTAYDTMMETAKQMDTILGDGSFKKQGDSYVWNFDKAKVLTMLGDNKEARDAFDKTLKELNLSITFSDSGAYTVRGTVKMSVQGLGDMLNMTLDESGDLSQDTTKMDVQVRNLFNLTMKATSRITKVQTTPDLTIPKDAQIIDLKELMLP